MLSRCSFGVLAYCIHSGFFFTIARFENVLAGPGEEAKLGETECSSKGTRISLYLDDYAIARSPSGVAWVQQKRQLCVSVCLTEWVRTHGAQRHAVQLMTMREEQTPPPQCADVISSSIANDKWTEDRCVQMPAMNRSHGGRLYYVLRLDDCVR